jgi:hypothetical protein
MATKRPRSPGGTHPLAKSLECPVCFAYMRGPIRNCPRGHSFCEDCLTAMNAASRRCGMCRAALPQAIRNAGRNYALEALRDDQLSAACGHSGCGVRVVCFEADELEAHRRACPWGPLPCFLCRAQPQRAHFAEHLAAAHGARAFDRAGHPSFVHVLAFRSSLACAVYSLAGGSHLVLLGTAVDHEGVLRVALGWQPAAGAPGCRVRLTAEDEDEGQRTTVEAALGAQRRVLELRMHGSALRPGQSAADVVLATVALAESS